MGGVAIRLFVALVATASLTYVPTVEAATVSMTAQEFVDVTLTYRAAPGERNRVVVTTTTDFSGWIVSESGNTASGPLTLTAGPGCTSLTPQIALCEHNISDRTNTPFHVVVFLGDSLVVEDELRALDTAWLTDACGPLVPFQRPLPWQLRVYGGPGDAEVFADDNCSDSVVRGGRGGDALHAGKGGSRLIGGRGDDFLYGGPRRDFITGGRGRDTITGGLGVDTLRGGPSGDTFYARDRYADRVSGGTGFDRARVDRGLDHVRSIERFFSERFCCA
jgi:Ca2+-binding RTX toxin-like protein